MTFEEYIQQYRSFQAGLMQVQLGLVVASEVFVDFPNRLPQSLMQEFQTYAQTVAGVMNASLTDSPHPAKGTLKTFAEAFDSSLPIHLRSPNIPANSLYAMSEKPWDKKFTTPFLMAIVSHSLSTLTSGNSFSFEKTINPQHLFLAFAHADVFASDSMQAILHTCPNRLKTNKSLSWQKIQELGSWEAVQAFMKDTLCFEFGVKCLADRICSLRDEFGVVLAADESELNELHEAELVRNLFMHAGGVANAEYEKRTKIRTHQSGDVVLLSTADVTRIISLIHKVCLAVFDGISSHFYKQDSLHLPGIIRRGEAPS